MEASAYKVYISKRYYFSLVCAFRKATKNLEINVDVQKGGGSKVLRIKLTIDVLVLFSLSMVVI